MHCDPRSLHNFNLTLAAFTVLLCLCPSTEALVKVTTYNPFGLDAVLTMQEIENQHSDLVTISSHRGQHALVSVASRSQQDSSSSRWWKRLLVSTTNLRTLSLRVHQLAATGRVHANLS